jgi:hypothetical protein
LEEIVLVTLTEAAARYGKRASHLRYWINKGELEAFRIRRRGRVLPVTYVRVEDVEMLAMRRGWFGPLVLNSARFRESD